MTQKPLGQPGFWPHLRRTMQTHKFKPHNNINSAGTESAFKVRCFGFIPAAEGEVEVGGDDITDDIMYSEVKISRNLQQPIRGSRGTDVFTDCFRGY